MGHRREVLVGDVRVPHPRIVGVEANRNAEPQIFRKRVPVQIGNILEQPVADEIDLNQVLAILHQQHGIGIGNQIDAMADAGRAQGQRPAYILTGRIHLASVKRKLNAAVGPPQFAECFQKAQRMPLVVIFPSRHVHADPQIPVPVHERIGTLE